MKQFWGLMAFMVGCNLAQASTTSISSSELSRRSDNPFGFSIGLGDPYPTLLGLKANYNFLDYLRAHVGWGEIEVTNIFGEVASARTIGAGVTGMMPGWNVTPTLGLSVSRLDISGPKGLAEVQGFDESGTFVSASVGIDYQSPNGYQLGTGLNTALSGDGDAAFYANFGWFFAL